MSHCAVCGQPVHPQQLTCGSCGASLRAGRAEGGGTEEGGSPSGESGRPPESVVGSAAAPPFGSEVGRERRDAAEPGVGGGPEEIDAGGPPPATATDVGPGAITRETATGAEPGARTDQTATGVGPGARTDQTATGVGPGARTDQTATGAGPGARTDETATGAGPDARIAGTAAGADAPPSPDSPPAVARRRRRPHAARSRTRGPVASPAFFSRAWAIVVDAMLLALGAAMLPTIARLGIRAAELVSGEPELYDDIILEQLTSAGTAALVVSYFVFLTAGGGQTVGKGLMGLQVVRTDGRPPDLLQSLVRAVGYVFSALPFGFGFLIAAFSPRRALHDYLAGTLVVRPRDMPRPEGEDPPP